MYELLKYTTLTCLIQRNYFFIQKTSAIPSTDGEGHCIWMGMCDENPEKPDKNLNCAYNGTAVVPDQNLDETRELLMSKCPDLVTEIGEYVNGKCKA